MKILTEYPISELKLIYQVLHSQIQQNIDLMDSSLLHDLQTVLQSFATNDGIDVALHNDWSAWLNNLTSS